MKIIRNKEKEDRKMTFLIERMERVFLGMMIIGGILFVICIGM